MTAHVIRCITIACDTCGRHDEGLDWAGPGHFPDRAEAARWMTPDGWEIPTTTPGLDLCPRCVCARDGHQMTPPDETDAGYRYSERCRTFEQWVSA